MSYKIELEEIVQLTPDTYRLTFPKPPGYDFVAGQATEVALDRDGWRDEKRPFTFTSQPGDNQLEFTIKSYPRGGVTEQIAHLERGEAVLIGEPFGAIRDNGPGVFIAGGAGVTPFIPILRKRHREGSLDGCMLIFANKTEKDIILRQEWQEMGDLVTVFTVTRDEDSQLPHRRVDEAFLKETVSDISGNFYVCGPPSMIDDVTAALRRLGAEPDALVLEE